MRIAVAIRLALVVLCVLLPNAGVAFSVSGFMPRIDQIASDGESRSDVAATPALNAATPAATPMAADATVEIRRFAFHPRRIEIPAGTTVKWINRDLSAHTATNLDDIFDTGRLDRNGTSSHRFLTPGNYAYECAYHKDMTGAVLVR